MDSRKGRISIVPTEKNLAEPVPTGTLTKKSLTVRTQPAMDKQNQRARADQQKTPVYKSITNPVYIGGGVWVTIHIMSAQATTDPTKKFFVHYMLVLSNTFPCVNPCRGHMKKYMKENPIRDYWNIRDEEGREIGCFKWGWKFHNAVNKRIGKAEMTWEKALELYYTDAGVCDADCTGTGESESQTQSSEPVSESKVAEDEPPKNMKSFTSVEVSKNNTVRKMYYDIVPTTTF